MFDTVILVRPSTTSKLEIPIGLLYVGTALQNAGYNVEIVDFHKDSSLEEGFADALRSRVGVVLGVTALAPSYGWVKKFLQEVRRLNPSLPIVVGGHVSFVYEQLLTNTGVDFVCTGEGEHAFPALMQALNGEGELDKVCGIARWENDVIVKSKRCSPVKTFLDPDYGLVDMPQYLFHPSKDMFFSASKERMETATPEDRVCAIMFSRGCVGACGFCYRHHLGYRQSSVDWCVRNMKRLYSDYNVRFFRVDDELFTNSIEWLQEFHDRVVEEDMDIFFRVTGIRVDELDRERLELLRGMGCIALNFGLESGSQQILNNMRKGTTVQQAREAIALAKGAGMITFGYFILGYEGESEETLSASAEFLLNLELDPGFMSIYYAMPFPGTKLFNDCVNKWGLIRNVDAYLESLAPYFEEVLEQHKYYFINVSEVTELCLRKWEQAIYFLLRLNKILGSKCLSLGLLRVIKVLPSRKWVIFGLSCLNRLMARVG